MSPSRAISFGTSLGGDTPANSSRVLSALDARWVRTYTDAQQGAVAGSVAQVASRKAIGTAGGVAGALVDAARLSDVHGVVHDVSIDHEYDNNDKQGGTVVPADYHGAWSTFLHGLTQINANRRTKLRPVQIYTGDVLHDVPKLTALLIPNVPLGFDIYNPHVVQLAADFARAHRLPWMVPELGYSVHVTGSDDVVAASMVYTIGLLRGVLNDPERAGWYNAGHNRIVSTVGLPAGGGYPPNFPGLPRSVSTYRQYCQGIA